MLYPAFEFPFIYRSDVTIAIYVPYRPERIDVVYGELLSAHCLPRQAQDDVGLMPDLRIRAGRKLLQFPLVAGEPEDELLALIVEGILFVSNLALQNRLPDDVIVAQHACFLQHPDATKLCHLRNFGRGFCPFLSSKYG